MDEQRSKRDRKQSVEKKVKKRRRKKALRLFLWVLLAVLILVACAFVFVFFFCDVTSVEYEGNTLYTDKEIKDVVFVDEYSDNTIYCFLKNRFFDDTSIPFVEDVTISLKDKNSLLVTVKEDELTGLMLDTAGNFVYFNSENVVVEISQALIDGVPLVAMEDVELSDLSEGDALPLKSKRDKELKKLFSCLKEQGLFVANVLFTEDGSIEMGYGQISIRLGPATDLEAKILRLKYILSQLEGQTGTLHLEDWDVGTRDIVFEKAK